MHWLRPSIYLSLCKQSSSPLRGWSDDAYASDGDQISENPLGYTVVPTMFDRRTQASNQALRQLKRNYPEELWRFAIPIDTKFRDASRMGLHP